VSLLLNYLFSGYSAERISAFSDIENIPAQSTMENMDFQREGFIRKGYFRDGSWHDLVMYGILRDEFKEKF
jgi:RimJ/RimL family protein N-acetyltransferase